MLNFFRRFNRTAEKTATSPARRESDSPLAIYLTPDGRQLPIKSTLTLSNDLSAWGYGVRSRDGSEPEFEDSEWGYALAAAACVWAYNCIDIRAQIVASILKKSARVVDKATGKVIEDHALMRGVDATWLEYRQQLWYEWEFNRCLFGENFTELVQKFMYGIGLAHCLRVINPLQIEPIITRGSIVRFDVNSDEGSAQLNPHEVSFDKLKNPVDDYRGMSLMRLAMSGVNIDMHVQTTRRSHFKNGLRPGIIFSVKEKYLEGRQIKEDDWKRFQQTIRGEAKGTRNAYRPLALDIPVDVTVLDPPSLEDTNSITDAQKERIAAAFRIPVPLVTFGDQKYQLSPEQRKYLYQEVLIPECEHIANVVTTDILPFFDRTDRVRFELDERQIAALTEDMNLKAEGLQKQFLGAQITFNQMQDALGNPKVAGGDFYLFPNGVTPVQQSGLGSLSAATLNPQPAAPPATAAIDAIGPHEAHSHEPPAAPLAIDLKQHPAIIHAKHDSAEDELAAWAKAYKQSGRNKALRFVTYLIREGIQADLKAALGTGDDAAIKAAFEGAKQAVSVKAIQATRLDFEGAFSDVLNEALQGNITRTRFGTIARSLLRTYARKAYTDGLKDGGIDEPTLTSDDETALAGYLAEQSVYVTDLGKALFKDENVTEPQADVKPTLWFNKSIYPAYQLGLLQADENGLYEWYVGRTERHCSSCLTMNGQKHRLKDYHARKILPKSDILDCSGMQCDCGIRRTTGRESGSWL